MISKDQILLSVKDINLTLGRKKILRDINFDIKDIHRDDVQQGQVEAILGQSGIGKSQLFRLLAGLHEPDSGTILVNSEQIPVKVGDMGVVFQDYFIYGWRKVSKIFQMAVEVNLSIKPDLRKDTIEEMSNIFMLSNHLNKFPAELSGGQRQRVAIAEQLLVGGNFLLMDEPFSGLDIIMISKVIDLLIKVSITDELKTIIIVSHDLSNTLAIADTVHILNKQSDQEGATIVKTIDLIERDLAYHSDIKELPQFRETLKEIKSFMI